MTVVVADTSPIHYLVLIDAIYVLPKLFDEVVVPGTVEKELLHPSTPNIVRDWMSQPPNWIRVNNAIQTESLNLDPGESEAISLAKELRAFAVILDDGEARRIARNEGLQVTGTLGILERAAADGLLNLPRVVTRLKQTTFYASPSLLKEMLDRDAARSGTKG